MTQTSSATLSGVSRALSPLERWYWICDQVSPLNVIAHARLHGRVARESFPLGLGALQQRHPLLCVAIAADPGGANPRFVPAEASPIPLRHVQADSQDAWERELSEHELTVSVDWRQGPLARALVVSAGDCHDLVLTLPHCISDGTTVLSLMRQWIELAAGFDAGTDSPPASLQRQPARPAPEDMFPARARGFTGAARIIAQQIRDQGTAALRRPRRLQASHAVPFTQRRTRWLRSSLSAAQLAALAQACRREQTTVHGALAAAMVSAVADDAGTGSGLFTIGSPIDIRPDLVPPVSGLEAGTYVATVPSVVPWQPGAPLWPMARMISRDLARRRRRGEPMSSVNLLKLAAPKTLASSDRFLRFMDERGPITLCLSNIGRYDFPAEIGRWQVCDAEFIASLSVNGMFVATVNSSHDRLAWNFTYVDQAIPDDRAQRLVSESVAAVVSAAGCAQ